MSRGVRLPETHETPVERQNQTSAWREHSLWLETYSSLSVRSPEGYLSPGSCLSRSPGRGAGTPDRGRCALPQCCSLHASTMQTSVLPLHNLFLDIKTYWCTGLRNGDRLPYRQPCPSPARPSVHSLTRSCKAHCLGCLRQAPSPMTAHSPVGLVPPRAPCELGWARAPRTRLFSSVWLVCLQGNLEPLLGPSSYPPVHFTPAPGPGTQALARQMCRCTRLLSFFCFV